MPKCQNPALAGMLPPPLSLKTPRAQEKAPAYRRRRATLEADVLLQHLQAPTVHCEPPVLCHVCAPEPSASGSCSKSFTQALLRPPFFHYVEVNLPGKEKNNRKIKQMGLMQTKRQHTSPALAPSGLRGWR